MCSNKIKGTKLKVPFSISKPKTWHSITNMILYTTKKEGDIMNILKSDIGVKSDNFILKLILATIIAFSTLITMYLSFKI